MAKPFGSRGKRGRRPWRRRAAVEQLEPRLLLSADLPGESLDAALPPPYEPVAEVADAVSMRDAGSAAAGQHASARELVIIDAGVEDREKLLDDLRDRGMEVRLLDADRDGVQQIGEILAAYDRDLDAVHLVSHGTDQGVQLGDTWLTLESLPERAESLTAWRGALTEDADLLIYGCNLAASGEGQTLADALSTLTGADVAASTDLTGAAALGGDWDLEYATGSLESSLAISAEARASFTGLLDGTAIWSDNGLDTPEANEFDGASFGTRGPTADVGGEWRVMAGAESPIRDEKIVVGVNEHKDLSVMIWDGTDWIAPSGSTIAHVSHDDRWGFDVAYESQSGRALCVYNNGNNDDRGLSYGIWDGTTLVGGGTIQTPRHGEPDQMRLAASPDSNEMVLVVSNEDKEDYALVWDGSSWGDAINLDNGNDAQDNTDVYVAYEQQSGHAMVVFAGSTTDAHYRIWDGSSWSLTEGTISAPAGASGKLQWTTLASDPNSDRIALGAITHDKDTWLAVWDGSGWEASRLATTASKDSNKLQVAVAFESTTGEAIATYATVAEDLRYRTWTSASGWSGERIGPNLGDHPEAMTLDADPASDTVMLSVLEHGKQVSYLAWDGSSWGAPSQQETDADTETGQPFLFLWDQEANHAPVANDDSASTDADTPVVIDVLANDTDPDGDPISVLDHTQPAHGTAVLNPDNTITYTPDPGYSGPDSFDYAISDVTSGMTHYWKLDGDAADSVGSSHGTVFGTTTVPGFYGDALHFDQLDDHAEIPDFSYANDFTVAFAFKVDDISGSSFQYLYSHGSVGTPESLNIYIGESGSGFAGIVLTNLRDVNDTSNGTALNADISGLVGDGQWHVYTLTVTSGVGSEVFIDGVSRASAARGGDGIDPGTPLYLGARQDFDADRFYGGSLDSVMIFDQALSPQEIVALTTGSLGRATVDITVNAVAMNTVPGPQSTDEDNALVFSNANGNAISVDGGTAADSVLRTSLSVTNGTLTLAGTVGLTFEAGGDGTASMTVSGLESAINAALDGLTYTPTADYHGPADLEITTESSIVSDASLQAYYSFENLGDPGNDDSPLGLNDGTVNGGTTPVFDATRSGNVLPFDGFDDSVRISGLFGEPSSVTLAAWVNLDGGFFDNEVLSIGNNISLRLDDTIAGNGVTGFFWDGGAWRHTDSNVFVNGTGWHHVAFTFDDANDLQAIYVDGVGGTPSTSSQSIVYDFGSDTYLGRNGASPSKFLHGMLDDARIYDRALSAGEITALVNEQTTATDNVAITVNPVNDAPAGTDGTVTTAEDTTHAFSAADFGFSDVDAGDSLVQVQITSLESAGSLQLSGADVTLGQVISAADIAAGNLSFTPAADENGIGYDSFEFRVHDGTAYSAATYTMTLDVTPVQDLPTGADGTVTTAEDIPYVFDTVDFGFGDVDASDSLAQIEVTSLESAGSLQLSGVDVTLGQVISVVDIAAGNLTFTPAADENGIGYDSFEFRVHDGTAYSAAAYTMTLDVTPVQDLPTGADGTVTTAEDIPYVFDTVDFGFGDVDAGDSLAQIEVTSLESAGSLQLSGVDVTLGQVISVVDIAAGNLTFTPAADENGIGYDSFEFRVHDGTAYSAVAYTMTVDVTSANDLPTGADGTVTTPEDTSYAFNVADFGFSDVDVGDSLFQVEITSLESAGSLQLSGVDVTLGRVISAADIVAGNLSFTPAADESGIGYDSFGFRVHDGAVYSAAAYTMTVDVTPAQDLPTGADGTVVTSEDTAHVFDTADFGFSDVDAGDNLVQVQITSLETAGSLQLSGADVTLGQVISAADIAAGNLTFTPAADENGVGYDSFGFRVHDGTAYSTAAYTMTLDVTPVQDLPTGSDATVTTAEDTAHVFDTADFGFSDVDAGDSLVQIQITSLESAGSLQLSGADVTLGQVISAADIAAGNLSFTPAADENGAGYDSFGFRVHDGTAYSAAAYTMTVDVTPVQDLPTGSDATVTTAEDTAHVFDTADFGFSDVDAGDSLFQVQITSLENAGSLQLGGMDVTLGQVISAVDIAAGNLTFTPAADENGIGYDSFGFRVHDGTAYSAAAYTMTVDVTPVQDLPTGADGTVVTSEDIPYIFNTVDFGFSDVDAGDSLVQVQITSLESAGSLQLSGADVTLGQVISAADIAAGNLSFTPAPSENGVGYDSFEFRVHDGTAYSAAAYTLTVDVTGVNDPPTASDSTIVTVEDTSYVFGVVDFGFGDVDAGDSLVQVQITSLETAGSLQLSGADVTLGQVISAADIAAGNLSFTPAADENGVGYDSFGFRVHDGAVYSAAAYTMTVDVTPAQDLPTGADATVTMAEDTAHVFDTADFGFSDVDAGDSLVQVQITSLETAGSLQLSGADVTLGQVISAADIAAGNLTFTPAADENGAGYDSFGFRVHDGTAYSAAAYTMTVDVTPAQDLPTGADATVTMAEDTAHVFDTADFGFSDVDAGDSLVQIEITSLESAGSLQLSGADVTLGQVISAADIAAGNLTFTPAPSENGVGYDSFEFRVHDGTAYSAAAYTMTVDVTPAQDLPTGADATVTMAEDTAHVFDTADFGFSDVDAGDSLFQIQITSLESAGSLQLSGADVTLGQVISVVDIAAGNLSFTPAADENGVGYDSFGFRVHDGTAYSAAAYTMTVDVTPVQDLPTGSDATVTTAEDTAHVFDTADFGFSDVDAGDSLFQVQITSLENAGSLQLGGMDVTLGQVISAVDIAAGNLSFTPAADENGAGYDSFGFRVHDGTAYSAAAYTMTVDVTPAQDLPTGADGTVVTSEDTAHVFDTADFGFSDVDAGDNLVQVQITSLETAGSLQLSGADVTLGQVISAADIAAGNLTFTPAADENGVGYDSFGFRVHDGTAYSTAAYTMTLDVTPVQDLPMGSDATVTTLEDTSYVFNAGDFGFSDVDTGDSLVQIQITSLETAGSLQLSGADVTLGQVISVVDIAAGNLSFTPAADGNGLGYDSFEFRVHDGTAYSAAAYTMTVDVTPVQDLPTAADNTVTTAEDTAYVFDTVDFGFSDVDAGDSLFQIQITSLESAGSLQLSGADVTLGQVISVVDIAAGNLSFTPAADENGIGYDSFDFRVHDGTAYSAAAYTMTVDVTPVQDLPTAADNTVTTAEDTAYVFGTVDFGFSDVDAGDSLFQIQITSLESAGSLQLSGADVTLGQVISAADIAAGNLSFTPAADESGVGCDSFGFRVHDGTAYSAAAYTMTVDVTPVQDPPVVADQGFSVVENSADGTLVGTVIASDVDAGDTLSYAITGGDPGGAFAIDPATGEITVFDSTQLDFETTPVFNLTVTVTDAGGLTDTASVTVSLANVNEVPTVSDHAFGLAENSATGTVVGTVNASDVDAGDTLSYAITAGNPGGAFAIDSATAQITVADSSKLDFETRPVFDLTVTVTDAGGLTDTAAVTVSLTDLNEAPRASDHTFALAENSANGTVVGTVKASDVDAGDTLSYSITAGDPAGAFAIDAATGEISVADASRLDFETTPVFNLTVTVTDAGGLTATGSIAVGPEELSDPPPEEIPEEADDPVTDPEQEIAPEEDPAPTDETPASPVADTSLPDVSAPPPEPVAVAAPESEESVSFDLSHRPDVKYETRSDALSVARTAIGVFEKVFDDEPLIAPGAGLTDLIFQQHDFFQELDRLQEEIESFVGLETTVVGSSIAATMGLSIGYVIWLTRGGLLLASLLSSLPAWRLIDPIAVLAFVGTDDEDDEDDEESLDSLISRGGAGEDV